MKSEFEWEFYAYSRHQTPSSGREHTIVGYNLLEALILKMENWQ